jgi:histidine ammonia-lyase
MSKLNIKPLKLKLRDGLGLINGTSCMTGISAINVFYSLRLINWGLTCSSILNEIVESFDDSFSKELNSAKLHAGQNEAASFMRAFLKDSKLIRNRNDFYNNSSELKKLKLKQKLQEYYSIRCIPQIIGPIVDTLNFSKNIIENELNSTNDNPIISIENNNVYHGGNFHGDYVSLEMDKVKIAMCKLSMLAERQLNFLLNPNLNNKFPLFLNLKRLGYNFGVQGLQFVATSTTAENQTLSNPMYIHSIPSNNDNQDIVSMGANSALITKKVIDNTFQVMAIHVFAICQAIDFLPKEDFNKLSSNTIKVYNGIRKVAPVINEDKSQSETLKSLIQHIKTHTINL